jgi:predicted TIM-barrel fold metal-dependent hydrolase
MTRLLAVLLLAALPGTARAADLPLFDAHLHYSHDAWGVLSAREAVELLRRAGVRRALVSSSDDEGTQRLLAEAPDLVVPSLRPYRTRGDVGTWVRDEAIVAYVEERLARHRYVALGEFHVYGADADLPVVRRMVALARQHGLLLHAHADADAVERLFRQDPDARILWAHAGFAPPEQVREMLRRYPRLWADLAFRSDHGAGGRPAPEWRAAFLEFPDRFLVGTDTFVPERWHFVPEHAAWSRAWLADLPPEVAERIAHRNGEALLGTAPAGTR